MKITRRDFLRDAASGGLLLSAGCGVIPPRHQPNPGPPDRTLRFGVISDVHFNLHPAAYDRLARFMQVMNRREVEFIIQLGDFTQGYSSSEQTRFDRFLELWNSFDGPKFHVLGNHDMDRCSKQEVMACWGMQYEYYSFDCAGYHFIVLDSNYYKSGGEMFSYDNGNYYKHPQGRSYLSKPQMKWLNDDLTTTDKPTVIFSHRGFDPELGVKDGEEARTIFEAANRDAGYQKVLACLCGHYHRDGYQIINGIPYIMVNSAVYHWLGGKWKWIEYADSLFAIVSLGPGVLDIEGRKSKLVPVWPKNAPDAPEVDAGVTAAISDLRFRFRAKGPGHVSVQNYSMEKSG